VKAKAYIHHEDSRHVRVSIPIRTDEWERYRERLFREIRGYELPQFPDEAELRLVDTIDATICHDLAIGAQQTVERMITEEVTVG